MALRYAKAAGGNWSAGTTWSATGSGGADNAGTPTASDDVIFEAGSGAVTINAAAVCRSLDCTSGTGAYTGTLTHAAAITLTIGTTTSGPGGVALKFSAGMTYTLGGTPGAALSFVSTAAAGQQTITMAGKTTGSVSFTTNTGSWLLVDSLTTSSNAAVALGAGTLNTNNQAHSWGSFLTAAGTKTLTLGSSVITLTGTTLALSNANAAGLTVTANTATFQSTTVTTVNLGATNWGGATFSMTGAGTVSITAGTFSNISLTRIGTAVKADALVFSGTGGGSVVNLTLQGNSVANRLLVWSGTTGTRSNLTVTGTVTVTNVDFTDMGFSGASTPLTGTSVGDGLGNTGVTFDAGVSTYWVGGTGSWSSTAKWASSSGGSGGTGRIPLPQDVAVLDDNSGSGSPTFTMDMPRVGKDLDASARTLAYTLTPTTAATLYGSMKVPTAPTANWSQSITFAGRGSHTLQFHTKAFGSAVTFAAVGGTYTLTDSVIMSSSVTHNFGTLDLAGFNASWSVFASVGSGTRSIVNTSGTTSTISLTSTSGVSIWNVTSSLTFGTNIPIAVTGVGPSGTATFTGGGKTYLSLTYTIAGSPRGLSLLDANTFGTINFSDSTNARTLTLPAGLTTTVTTWNVNGTAGKLMSVVSSTAGTAATLSVASGVVSSDYLSLQDIAATGGATFYAGTHSTNVSGNTGWSFTAPSGFVDSAVIDFLGDSGISGAGSLLVLLVGADHSADSDASGAGSVLATPPAAIDFGSDGTMIGVGAAILAGLSAMSADSDLSGAGAALFTGTAALQSDSDLAGAGGVLAGGPVIDLAADGALSGAGALNVAALPVTLASDGTLTGAGVALLAAAGVTLTADSDFVGSGVVAVAYIHITGPFKGAIVVQTASGVSVSQVAGGAVQPVHDDGTVV